MALLCQACDSQVEPSDLFCVACGQALDALFPESQDGADTPSPDAKKVCIGCQIANDADARYCYGCGLELPSQLYTLPEVVGDPAGFWIRFWAYVMDQILLTIVGLVMAAILNDADLDKALDEVLGESTGWATVLSIPVTISYYTFAIAWWGQTAGKAILGLKVTRTDGSRLSIVRSFARFWAYLVSTIPLGLGFVAIALSSRRRGWHDLIVDTRVVNIRN